MTADVSGLLKMWQVTADLQPCLLQII